MRTAAEAGADLAARRYEHGLAPQLTVFSAQDVVIQARREDAVLATDAASARVALVMAMGGGFIPRNMSQAQEHTHE